MKNVKFALNPITLELEGDKQFLRLLAIATENSIAAIAEKPAVRRVRKPQENQEAATKEGEPVEEKPEKKRRKRRTKAEMEAAQQTEEQQTEEEPEKATKKKATKKKVKKSKIESISRKEIRLPKGAFD